MLITSDHKVRFELGKRGSRRKCQTDGEIKGAQCCICQFLDHDRSAYNLVGEEMEDRRKAKEEVKKDSGTGK